MVDQSLKFNAERLIRTRIAPAPTGFLHLGTARTALFNWLFSRKYGGDFILRIEDTDLERSKPEWEKDILESLKWLGLDWDEGPYRQSERTESYKKYIGELLDKGLAYHCFCSAEDLEAERQEMLSRGVAPKYSGRCRNLSPEKVRENLSAGKKSIIRFKMPEKKVSFDDLIRGKIEFDTAIFGDIAIAKSPSVPLYNLAVVIDDYEMRISHVIRGEDHISNTPKQLLLQEALGFSHPEYGHLPLILGPDRTKLSKRHGATAIREYREAGYLAEAMINFMALLGWHPAGDKEFYSVEELISEFSLERIQKAGAVFTSKKLDWMNAHYIREKSAEELLGLAKPFWEKAGFRPEKFGNDYLLKVISVVKERLIRLADLASLTDYFFIEPSYPKELLLWKDMAFGDVRRSLEDVAAVLSDIPDELFTAVNLEQALGSLLAKDRGRILWPMRAALSGREASAGPFEIAAILGKAKTIERLLHAAKIVAA